MISGIRKRLLTPADGQAIRDLYVIIRPQGEQGNLDRWRWQFVDNPVGKIFSFVAEDESSGEIVSQGALLPTWLNVSGKKIMASQSVGSMTHPAYTRRGLFASLARESYTYAASEGVSLLYGFPNESAYPVFVNLGWSNPGRLPCLVKIISRKSLLMSDLRRLPQLLKILNPKTLFQKHGITQRRGITKIASEITKRLARSRLNSREAKTIRKAAGNIRIESIDTFDNRFDDFWLKVKDTLPITTWRDSKYLNWRYCSCPDEKYTIFCAEEDNILAGFIVIKCQREEENTGCIVDFLSLPEKAGVASPLICAALDYFKNQSMDTAMCHTFEHSPLYQFIKAQGFREYGQGARLIVRPNTPDLPASALDRKQWYLMEGDIDTF